MEPFVWKHAPIPHFTIPAWEALNPLLSVGFTTKSGGQSKGPYQSMNVALHVKDNEFDVIANRKKLASSIGFPFEAWTSADQVHGNHVEVITMEQRGRGRLQQSDAISKTDGLLTNIPDILLVSFYADCVPLYFLDPKKMVVGLAHAGWKGTVLKIGEKMIEQMKYSFGSSPMDIKVAIGPAISQCCYEVNNQVVEPLQDSIQHVPLGAIKDKNNGHFDLDLKKINEQILIDAGIERRNIELSTWCTSCHPSFFYSHRRDRGVSGRMASWIGLRKDE